MNKKPNGFVCHHTSFLSDKWGLQMKSQTNAGKRSRVRAVFFFFGTGWRSRVCLHLKIVVAPTHCVKALPEMGEVFIFRTP